MSEHATVPLPGIEVARARNRIDNRGRLHRDPPESFEAARSAGTATISRIKRAVVNTLRLAGRSLSDEAIVERVQGMLGPRTPGSSIRSRRAELVRDGILERDPQIVGTTRAGNSCALWRLG